MLEALSILGYGTSYNTREMLKRNHSSFCAEGLRRKHEDGKVFDVEQYESLWGEYRTISGEPAYIFAKECIQLYPDAKVILTVRDDEQEWHRSLLNTMWKRHRSATLKFLPYVDKVYANLSEFTTLYWKHLFANDAPRHGIRIYREHNAMVMRLAKERLLVFNTKDGWAPLCEFLAKDIPNERFPHVNSSEEFHRLHGQAHKRAFNAFAKRLLIACLVLSALPCLRWWQKSTGTRYDSLDKGGSSGSFDSKRLI